MLAFHHVQADGLVPDRDQQADGLAGRDRQRRHVRLRFMDQEGRLVEAPGQLHAERPRSVFAIVFGDEAPALEQRHLPVQRALRQAGLFGQRRDAERPVMPGQRGQHIQDAIRAGADRGSGVKIHLQTNWSGDYQFMALILQIIPEN